MKIIEFSNCGVGDGQFLVRHVALVTGLKTFTSQSYKLDISLIPGAAFGGYNYILTIYESETEIEQFLNNWAQPIGLKRPLNFLPTKKKDCTQ